VLSLREYFRRYELRLIVCEPSARNPGPNRLLQKLGFSIARTYVTTPSDVNREHEVNRYEITPADLAAAMAKDISVEESAVPFEVRDAVTPSEWDEALALLKSMYVIEGFTSPARAQRLFDRGYLVDGGTLRIALVDNRIVGVALIGAPASSVRQIAGTDEAELRILGVAPEYRGRGIGEQLVRDCISVAAARRAKSLVLSTQPMMTAAHRLYERLGFVRVSSRDWTSPSGRTMWVYALDLTGTGA
jgi:ribosomal protein S18 acetylase RimI-like enzyme